MKIKIAENIRTLRKQHSFTQEQLSEALGVTVSAVYKWESGQSVPEVKMLMELADLFEISVDTLLGYDRQNENVDNRIKRIEQCMAERDFKEAVLEAEKTLKKYPNKFDVVYAAACVYMVIYSDKKDEKAMQRAIDLFYCAIPLLYQNKESSINEATILNAIGNMYIDAGQDEKGLELLKKNNICGINSATIGLTLAMKDRGGEAREYLYRAYSANINNTLRTMCGMLYMYGERKDGLYKEVGEWLLDYLDSLVFDKEAVTFIDKLKAIILAQMSVFAATFENYNESENYMKDAYLMAIKFDASPDYSIQSIRFWKDLDMPALLLDGLGETAISAIENHVLGKAKQGASLDFIKRKFEVLKSERITE